MSTDALKKHFPSFADTDILEIKLRTTILALEKIMEKTTEEETKRYCENILKLTVDLK